MAAARDYYETLGVTRSASDDEIRSAHRRLARQFHPDLNKDPGAGERFNEVQQAYEVLKDPEKRKKYDRFGHAGLEAEMGGGPGAGGASWQEMDPDAMRDIFGDIFGDAFGGGSPGVAGGRRSRTPRPAQGRDREHELAIGFAVAAKGGSEQLRLRGVDGSTETIDVRIPSGVADGTRLRVRGRGESGIRGGPRGDLILSVRVGRHPWFEREGLDLSMKVPITIAEAALGTSIEVPLLAGRASLKIPAGTSSGARLRLRGKGITDAKGATGDLLVAISITAPKELDEQDRAALESMATRLPDPRAGAPWSDG